MTRWTAVLILATVVTSGNAKAQSGTECCRPSQPSSLLRCLIR